MGKGEPFCETCCCITLLLESESTDYKHAKDCGFVDDDDLFLIGDSGGFLLNINPNDSFVNIELFTEMANFYKQHHVYTHYKQARIDNRSSKRQ